MENLVINTSWSAALLCFMTALVHVYFGRNGWLPRASMAQAVTWALWGVCYIMTQYGPDWFISNQRAFFRLASTGVTVAGLFYLYKLYPIIRPIVKNGNGRKSSS